MGAGIKPGHRHREVAYVGQGGDSMVLYNRPLYKTRITGIPYSRLVVSALSCVQWRLEALSGVGNLVIGTIR